MEEQATAFLDTVLKTIACTPNRNFDPSEYSHRVVEPTRRIRKLSEELGGRRPSDAQIREVMDLLLGILQAKQVDMGERESRIHEILDGGQIRALFPDLLPLRR
jgi:hypothetical protein